MPRWAASAVAVGRPPAAVGYERASERFYAFGLLACCRLSFNRHTDRTTPRPGQPRLAW